MDYFPIFLTLKQQSCLVVGGGDVARRKISLLKQAGAAITVVSPEACAEVVEWAQKNELTWIQRAYEHTDLEGRRIVIAATNQREVNAAVSAAAQGRSIPVNVVDQPDLCSFIMPAIVDRSPIIIAISTGGGVPVLARLLRARLESWIPATYGDLAQLAVKFRDRVKAKFHTTNDRRIFWEDVLQGDVAEKMFAGKKVESEAALELALQNADAHRDTGAVYLVGAGPGNPDLLTFRALRLIQQADVVLYDNLVSPAIVDLCRRDADRIYVGKKRANHAVPQENINAMLVNLAKEGKRVLRLKGGDPFIFGRGGEELEEVTKHNIPFEVVPGITSAAGASSYAGIPLTHRDYAQSVTFVTGHRREGHPMELDWPALARERQTIVFYMGLSERKMIADELMKHGLAPSTPVALVERATTDRQRTVIGRLDELAALAEQHNIQPPALIILGEVVNLHDKLNWFRASLTQPTT